MIYRYSFFMILTLLLGACEEESELIKEREEAFMLDSDTVITFSSGQVDFSNYVAVGNSLTAGFMDGALYKVGQEGSMPNILASSFKQVGGGEFIQPIIDTENGFNNSASDTVNKIIKGRFILDTSIPGPVPTEGDLATLQMAFEGDKVNNYGVPGLRAIEVASPLLGGEEGNPYYRRIASNPGTSTYLGDVATANATFLSVWLGNNDVLSYALSGASAADGNTDQTLDAARSTLVSEASFTAAYNATIATLFSADQKGVLLTIPPVTLIPFFRAVGFKSIPFAPTKEDTATLALLNGNFATFNGALDQLVGGGAITEKDAAARKISYQVGANPILIIDEDLIDISAFNAQLAGLGQIRPADPTDLILLSAGAILGTTIDSDPTRINGVTVPLGDQYVLTKSEQELIAARTNAFNDLIRSKANDNIAIFDIYNYFITKIAVEKGFTVEGQVLSSDFSPNGVFSTDGIHPNTRGNAIIANEIIDVINAKWNAVIPKVSPLDFPGITVKGG